MTRAHRLVVVGGLVFAGLWYSASRAEEPASAKSDPTSVLLSRIEALEKRIATLEEKDKAARQVSGTYVPMPCPPRTLITQPVVPQPQEAERPKGRILLLKHSETTKQ